MINTINPNLTNQPLIINALNLNSEFLSIEKELNDIEIHITSNYNSFLMQKTKFNIDHSFRDILNCENRLNFILSSIISVKKENSQRISNISSKIQLLKNKAIFLYHTSKLKL